MNTNEIRNDLTAKAIASLISSYEEVNGVGSSGISFKWVQEPCRRCGGQGGSTSWNYTGYTCYRCLGSRFESSYIPRVSDGELSEGFASVVVAKIASDVARKEAAGKRKEAKLAKGKESAFARYPVLAEFEKILAGPIPVWSGAADIFSKICAGNIPTGPQLAVLEKAVNEMPAKLAEKASREAKEASAVFVGEVGERITVTVKIVAAIPLEGGMYGPSTIYLFEDENGSVLKWKTTAFAGGKGDKVILTGRVTGHIVYNNVKQTELTRCKVVMVDELVEA